MSYPHFVEDRSIAARMRAIFFKLIAEKTCFIIDFDDIDWGTVPSNIAKKMMHSNSVPGFTTIIDSEKDGRFVVKIADLEDLYKNNDILLCGELDE